MATGKSTVGQLLANRIGADYVDTDTLIEADYGPIDEIFAAEGEAAFRHYEREVAERLSARIGDLLVISTGARFMLDTHHVAALDGARVFCLHASVETIVERLATSDVPRPLLAGGNLVDRVTHLMDRRREGYAAFEAVDTDGLTPDEIVDELITRLNASS